MNSWYCTPSIAENEQGVNGGKTPCQVFYLGRIGYREAYELQKQLVKKRIKGEIPDTLLLLEHPPVFTVGRSGTREHILGSLSILNAEGIEVFDVDRGGDVTYHGPGQLVGYPILDLQELKKADLHRVINLYEEFLIRLLADYGLRGSRFPGYPGVWVGPGKVAAIGIGVQHWVTYHGFALNVAPQLHHFELIVPCGIQGAQVASLSTLLKSHDLKVKEVARKLADHFAGVFGLQARWLDAEGMKVKNMLGRCLLDTICG